MHKQKTLLLLIFQFAICYNALNQMISTVAGNGTPGYSGDGGLANAAQLNNPISVAFDLSGNLYISDFYNHRIRKVTKSTGIITTIAGTGIPGFSGDGAVATNAQMNNPGDLCLDASGNIYFVDHQNFRVRKIDAITNIITTVAGNGGASYAGGSVQAISAGIHYPNAVAVDANNLYFSLFSKHVVCKVNLATGILSTIAGNFVIGFSGDGGPAINAGLGYPGGLTVDAGGEILVADYNNSRIRKINAAGIITTIAGNGTAGYSGDGGLAIAASLNFPTGVATDTAGNIYIADRLNNRIRKIDAATGIISTVAGSGIFGYGGDMQSATSPCTRLADPHKVRVDASGNIFISDQSNARIRKVDTTPVIPLNPAISITGNDTGSCSGQNITFHAAIINGGNNPVYQWKVNGVPAGTNTPSFNSSALKNGDTIFCELSVNTGCGILTVISNMIIARIVNTVIPALSIAANSNSICEGSKVSFQASAVNGGLSPVYQWQINGNNTGTNSDTFSTSALKNGEVITCIMISAATCANPASVSSNRIAINVKPKVTPAIVISTNAANVCEGSNVVFNAVATNGGTAPSYQWKINGNVTGNNSDTFSSSTLRNGDIVTCSLIADSISNCVTTSVVTSQPIQISVLSTPSPAIVIATPDNAICPGTEVTFTASTQNAGPSPIFQWKQNNLNTGQNSMTYKTYNLADGDIVQCMLTAPNSGCQSSIVTSNTITISLKSTPTVSITPLDTTVLEGSQILLTAHVTGVVSSFQWSPPGLLVNPPGLSSLTVPMTQNTTFSIQVTNNEGCLDTGQASVKVYKPLLMPTAFTPNNDGLNDVFRIPPNVILTLTNFSIFNRWGNRIFSTDDINKGWDGTVDSKPTNSGTFIYLVEGDSGGKQVVLKGTFLLIR